MACFFPVSLQQKKKERLGYKKVELITFFWVLKICWYSIIFGSRKV